MDELLQPKKPDGFWNKINPWSNANKEYKRLNKIWFNKNASHIDITNVRTTVLLKSTSHGLGVLITALLTVSPWILPMLSLYVGAGTNINNQYYFSLADHIWLTIVPIGGHVSLFLLTKLGPYGKILKYILLLIPIILTFPILIYFMFYKHNHKKECPRCIHHSNKIIKKESEN